MFFGLRVIIMGRFQITWLMSYNLLGLNSDRGSSLFYFPLSDQDDGVSTGNRFSATDKAFLLIDNFIDTRSVREVI